MPSLNLKTKTLRYAKADETALDACMTLLGTIVEYDAGLKKKATDAGKLLGEIWSEVIEKRARPEKPRPTEVDATPAPKT